MITYTQYLDIVRPIARALEQLQLDLKWHLEDIGNYAVHQIKTRVKEYDKVIRKLQRGNYQSAADVTDIAGMRIVVLGQPDVEPIASLFKGQQLRKDIEIVEDVRRSDPSGYKARHLVIKIRPSYRRSASDVFVEVQLRTLAEDLFDTLSRLMWYNSPINDQQTADPLIVALVGKLSQVDDIVSTLRDQWEDAYAKSAADSEMTPHSFARIVAEVFRERVDLYNATEEVRFLRDRNVKSNKDLRAIFTSPQFRAKVELLTSGEFPVFNRENLHVVYISVACHPGWADVLLTNAEQISRQRQQH